MRYNNGGCHQIKGALPRRKYRRLFIQGDKTMATLQLLATAAAQYGISPEEDCNLMEQDL